jgi:threonine synthase
MPVEKMILGEGWIQDVELPQEPKGRKPEEGLLSALNRITPDQYSSVAIVDDHDHARRLIRRILQSQGDFTIYEATDGREAVELARREHPDVMILDLMMPEMDGFAVLDALKADESTASIAVIVVTAKALTPDEQNQLRGRIHSLMQKGEFLDDELVEEINALLKSDEGNS